MGAQFTIPLIEVIPGQLIASALWNNEWNNLNTNFIPAGMDSYSDTDAQMQIQTNPYPGSVTSHASSLGGEIERIRYQISQIIGQTYWYQSPVNSLANLTTNLVVPLGGVIDYPAVTPPGPNWVIPVGQAISRTTYATLFSIMSVTFGVGDGSTTFNLPNYQNVMSIGAGGTYGIGTTGGAVSNTPTISITDPGHTHVQNSHTHTTPNHTHPLATIGTNANNDGSSTLPIIAEASGGMYVADGTGALVPILADTTTNSGGGTSGATTAVENSNTTGITATSSSVPTLSPYLAMYKMMRIL